jgi:hypothetical protein
MHKGKKQDVLNYIAALISIALSLCFLLFLLHMLSHFFSGTEGGIPFFINDLLKVTQHDHLKNSALLKFSSFFFLIFGTLFFGYLSWLFTHQLSRYKTPSPEKVSNHRYFQWKIIGVILIILLIMIGYFMMRFYR